MLRALLLACCVSAASGGCLETFGCKESIYQKGAVNASTLISISFSSTYLNYAPSQTGMASAIAGFLSNASFCQNATQSFLCKPVLYNYRNSSVVFVRDLTGNKVSFVYNLTYWSNSSENARAYISALLKSLPQTCKSTLCVTQSLDGLLYYLRSGYFGGLATAVSVSAYSLPTSSKAQSFDTSQQAPEATGGAQTSSKADIAIIVSTTVGGALLLSLVLFFVVRCAVRRRLKFRQTTSARS